MYKLSLHIICTRSVIKFSVLGGKYRTDFRYFRYLVVDIRYISVLWIPTSVSVSVAYLKISDISSVFRYTDPRLLSVNSIPLPTPSWHSFRRFHSVDIDSFLCDLQSSRLITSPPTSLGSLLMAYNTTLSTLLDKHAPVITNYTTRRSKSSPWFTSTLRAFRATVRHAENLYKRTHSALDWSSFKSPRNHYHKL